MNESYPKQSNFRDMLLSRHDATDTICVSVAMLRTAGKYDGDFKVDEHFCNGVDDAVDLIERTYQRDEISAIWTNLQRLIPGSKERKKHKIDAYTNIVIDIDRRVKKDADGNKVNATEAERAVLLETANKIAAFLAPQFGHATFADSGNGFHLSWRCWDMKPDDGGEYYRELLAVLRHKFEQADVNMEIDVSLSDETQVVTVWGTWNRKYENTAERPQRQSKLLYLPALRKIDYTDIMVICAENPAPKFVSQPKTAGANGSDKLRANPEWLENFGVPDLVDFFGEFIAYEKDGEYEKGGEIHHPITPCPCHKDEEFHNHSHERDCEIIEYPDGGIGISCFSRDFGLRTVIAKLNQLKGEKYPHRVYAEKPADEMIEELFDTFGVQEDKDAVVSPVGELCHEVNCNCGRVHVLPQKPPELFEDDKSFDLVKTKTDTGYSGLRVIKVSDSPDRPVDWLWPNRLPAGSAFTCSGPVGCNKSMALIQMASRITTGSDWPDGEKNEWGARSVLICATEDELQTVIRPRLRAAGADLEKCLYLQNAFEEKDGKRASRTMDLEKDTQRLYEALQAYPDILLVILDPVTGFYGNADPNDNRKIRKMIEKIAKMCMKTRTSVACIVHENKKSDVNVVDKMMGAGSMSQVVRAGMRFSFDPERKPNGRIMASLKNSYGGRGGGMRFDIEQMDMMSTGGKPLKNIGYVEWKETHDETADEVVQKQKQEADEGAADDTKLAIAMKIFQEQLKHGKRFQRDVHLHLDAADVSDETKRRARRKLGVISSRSKPWTWALPGKEYAADSREQKIIDQEEL
jgi:RecA-family ATPase